MLPKLSIDMETVQTNIIIINIEKTGKHPDEIIDHLKLKGLLVTLGLVQQYPGRDAS